MVISGESALALMPQKFRFFSLAIFANKLLLKFGHANPTIQPKMTPTTITI